MEYLSVAETVLNVAGFIGEVHQTIEGRNTELNTLRLGLTRAWMLFERMVNHRVQGNRRVDIERGVKDLISVCYDIEDYLDLEDLKDKNPRNRDKFKILVKGLLGTLRKSHITGGRLEGLNAIMDQWRSIFQEYNQPPPPLNMDAMPIRCLAYLLLFPDNHDFTTNDLVHLWVREGFVEQQQTGEGYVTTLEDKLIPLTSGSSSFKLNNFGKYFAMVAASGTCLHLDQGAASIPSSSCGIIRHLSLSCDLDPESWSDLVEKLGKLRTFLSVRAESDKSCCVWKKIPYGLCKSFSTLRVLSLRKTDVAVLPSFICYLRQLRYLDISFTKITCLGNSAAELVALQCLKIKGTDHIKLPKEFCNLTDLKYVDWEYRQLNKHKSVPRSIGKLRSLQSLPLFRIRRSLKDTKSIKELKYMNELQGSICIDNLDLVRDRNEAAEAMLHNKCRLEKIVLQWKRDPDQMYVANHKDVLTALQPNESVKELQIINYQGDDLPEWMSNTSIEKVHLKGCSSCCLPSLGKMQHLKYLVLEDMDSVTGSCRSDGDIDSTVRFPSLEVIELYDMPRLQHWTGLYETDRPLHPRIVATDCPMAEKELKIAFPLSSIIYLSSLPETRSS